MAVYHCHTHAISRSARGGSAIACAAYRSGEKLQESGQVGGGKVLSAAELAAYRTGGMVGDATGKVHDYTRKGGVAHAEIMLPKGVDAAWAQDRAALWNQAEAAEVRKNSRVAREWRVALPHELGDEERLALARAFAARIVDRYGVAADVAVHAPSRSGDQRNWHAHILCTTRAIGNEGFGEKATIEWSNANLAKEGLPYTSVQIREMRMIWEEVSNAALDEAGRSERIDHRSYVAQGIALEAALTVHVGQIYAEERDQVEGTDRIIPIERLGIDQSARNAALIADEPEQLLGRLTQHESVFTRHDVAKALHRYVNEDWQQFETTLNRVMASESIVRVHEEGERSDGRYMADVFTTRDMLEREGAMLETAERLSVDRWEREGASRFDRWRGRDVGMSERALSAAQDAIPQLSDEQFEAVRHVASESRLAIVKGQAGTGKTTMLSAVREAADHDGVRVVGASLSGKAARELQDGSGIESRTLASLERSWEAGFDRLGKGDLLVIDEAGMVGAGQMSRVLDHVEKAGAKAVLVGDARQLQPIESGAAFRNITERIERQVENQVVSSDGMSGDGTGRDGVGGNGAARTEATRNEMAHQIGDRPASVELTQVRRQKEDWQRQATNLFAEGEAGKALDLYRDHGCVTMHAGTDVACAAMVEAHFAGLDAARSEWAESGRDGEPDHVLTAYRNADVDTLNLGVREELIARGELGEDFDYRTDRGTVAFAIGDQVLFTANDRELGVANGDRGTVTAAAEDKLTIMLRGREGEKAGRGTGAGSETGAGAGIATAAEVEIDAEHYQGIRHGYAVTTHRAQGMTVDRIEVLAGRGMDAPLAYVAMTRQRDGAVMHGSEDDFRDYAALRSAVSRDRMAEGIGDYVPDRATLDRLRTVSDEKMAAADRQRAMEPARGSVIDLSSDQPLIRETLVRDESEADSRPDANAAVEMAHDRVSRQTSQAEQQDATHDTARESPDELGSEGKSDVASEPVEPGQLGDPDRGARLRAMMAEFKASQEDPEARAARLRALFQKDRAEARSANPGDNAPDENRDQANRIARLREQFRDDKMKPQETPEQRGARLRASWKEQDAASGGEEREAARIERLRAAFRQERQQAGRQDGNDAGQAAENSPQEARQGRGRNQGQGQDQGKDLSQDRSSDRSSLRTDGRERGSGQDDGAEQ